MGDRPLIGTAKLAPIGIRSPNPVSVRGKGRVVATSQTGQINPVPPRQERLTRVHRRGLGSEESVRGKGGQGSLCEGGVYVFVLRCVVGSGGESSVEVSVVSGRCGV